MGEDGGVCAGSGRSIDGFDLHEAISACGEHLLTYGGHAMAAGLKCEASKLDAFRDALHAYAMAHLDPALLAPTLRVDCDARLTDMNHAVVEQIESMSPFGRGNPAARVRLRDLQIVGRPESMGRYGKHLSLRVQQEGAAGHVVRLVGFGLGEHLPKLAPGQRIHAVVEPKINRWNGRVTVEGEVRDIALG
jgi:single-stranded-DNA-specific exonuclease